MWKITDAHGRKRIVDGEGVIGQQPLLNPGQAHQYISGCDFPTPLGKMEGHYVMQKENGEEFKVKIPAFILANIAVLN